VAVDILSAEGYSTIQIYRRVKSLHVEDATGVSSDSSPLPVVFKVLLHGQEDRVFHWVFKFTYYTRSLLCLYFTILDTLLIGKYLHTLL
jgi:hypothetical protein